MAWRQAEVNILAGPESKHCELFVSAEQEYRLEFLARGKQPIALGIHRPGAAPIQVRIDAEAQQALEQPAPVPAAPGQDLQLELRHANASAVPLGTRVRAIWMTPDGPQDVSLGATDKKGQLRARAALQMPLTLVFQHPEALENRRDGTSPQWQEVQRWEQGELLSLEIDAWQCIEVNVGGMQAVQRSQELKPRLWRARDDNPQIGSAGEERAAANGKSRSFRFYLTPGDYLIDCPQAPNRISPTALGVKRQAGLQKFQIEVDKGQ